MSQHNRRRQKVDANQQAIVKALRKLPGISVQTGMDDLLIGCGMQNYWIELKNPEVCRPDGTVRVSAKKPSQIRLEHSWTGQYNIVSSYEEILDIIGYK